MSGGRGSATDRPLLTAPSIRRRLRRPAAASRQQLGASVFHNTFLNTHVRVYTFASLFRRMGGFSRAQICPTKCHLKCFSPALELQFSLNQ